jgi:hypothetical protein
MHLVQGCRYTVPGSSLYIYVRKIRYRGNKHAVAIIEFVKKDKWVVFQTIKNAKLYYHRISHWEKVKEHE